MQLGNIPLPVARHARADIVELAKKLAGALAQIVPGRRHLLGANGAVHQLHAQLPLDLRQMLGDGSLRQIKAARCGGEPARLADCKKNFETA